MKNQNSSFSQKIYWLNNLCGELTETRLILDYVRPESNSEENQFLTFGLPDDLSKAIIKFTKGSYLSIYLVLLSVLSILLYKYTGNRDIVIGSPTYQENRVRLENQVVPLRLSLSDQLTFKDLLLQAKEVTINAYSHQNYPFDQLIQLLKLPQAKNRCSIFDVVVLLENIHHQKSTLNLSNDVTISFVVDQDIIRCTVGYSRRLFRDETIKLISQYYVNAIETVFQNINTKISSIDLLKEADKRQLLEEFNNNKANYPVGQAVHRLFEAQVSRTPNKVAVVCEGSQLTYQQLNEEANQLADFLQSLGIRKGELVAILKGRDIDFLTAILAILKVGGVYVPIDSTYPPERIKYVLSNSEARLLLTHFSFLKLLTNLVNYCPQLKSIVCLDETSEINVKNSISGVNLYSSLDFSQTSRENLGLISQGSDPAYMIYTSGSTGVPKGAIISHGAAINHMYAQFKALEFTEDYGFLQSAPASSDISVWQFLAPLLIGGKTVIVDSETVSNPEKLFQVIKEENLSIVELVPVVLTGLLSYISRLSTQQRLLPDLKWMMVTGESVSVELVNQWLRLYPSIKIVNAYGPTEAADDITQCIVKKPLPDNQRTVSIGKPLANLNLYILDSQMNLVPIGVPGEIAVSGYGVGEGYWKNQAKTNLSFVPNPFPSTAKPLPGTKRDLIYKTGDLGRWLPDGTIEFLGRIDNQVKIRGFRIELGEIEALLNQHPAVQASVVVIRGDSPSDKHLVAYIVPNAASSELVVKLRNFLEERLPQYMLPTTFVSLEALPLTPNGKVDRKALPAPDPTQVSSQSLVTPATPVEEMLAGIWMQVLGLELGTQDNFFALGGHSLLATRVVSQVRQVFQIELPLRRLFEKPTIADLAKDIEAAIKTGVGIEVPPIQRLTREGGLPLSFAQQRLWFLAQLEPESPFYNIPAAVRLHGQLNRGALEQTFNEILRRHEALRMNFETVGGQPIALISPVTPLQLPLLDLSELRHTHKEAEVKQLALAEAQHPFNLKCDLLLRVKLLRLGKQEHVLLMTMHHIASDGWSIGVMLEEVATLYVAFCAGQPSPLPELPIQYADFAAWQRQWLQGEVLQAQTAYWRQQLEGAPAVLELPTDQPRPAVQTFRGASCAFKLSQELSLALNQLSQQAGSTLFMTLLAAFKVLLGRYTSHEDIVVGTPIANRHRAEIEGLIGFFVNTLVLRTDLSGNPSFKELLTRVREVALGAYAHQDLPFERLVEEIQPQRSLSHTPLFQVMFALQNAPMSEIELPGLTLSPVASDSGTVQFDLTLTMEETTEGLVGTFEYNTDLFKVASIEQMQGCFQTLLEGIVTNPDQKLANLPLLTAAQQQQLQEWNDTETEYPQDIGIHQLIEAQVEQTPEAIAVVFANQSLTYRELNTRANQLAHYLRSLGVKPEVLVGICMERSLELVVGLLGILKAGGAYVPLDPMYPAERLALMMQDAQVPILLTQSQLSETLPLPAKVICLDTQWNAIAQHSLHNPESGITAANLAYVIYTSGSTGKPKGVMNTHRGLSNRLLWMQSAYQLTPSDRVLQKTPFSFDVSIWEFFWSLLSGARLIIAQPGGHQDSAYLVQLIANQEITTLHFVPSMLQVFLEEPGLEQCQSLKRVICSGEALPLALQERFFARLDAELYNLYGPTEAAIDVTFWHCQHKSNSTTVPIGYPIANTQLYILDREGQPTPIGVPGELHISGDGLARGYLNRPELTAQMFIPNPFQESAVLPASLRLYKTGDLARYQLDGSIEFLERLDNQVKLRGFRIELGEIEATLAKHPQVLTAVVVVREQFGDRSLIAYVVPSQRLEVSTSTLRHFLLEKLPEYMVPAAFVQLEALPLTPNGKVNRQALPLPDVPKSVNVVLPRNGTEKVLANIFADVLRLEKVSVYDNFFELGGHSLLATQVISRLREAFKMELPLRSLFERPTVADLGDRIETMRLITQVSPPLAVGKGRKEIEL